MIFLVKIRNGDNIMHKIDLKKYEIRTDMALDLLEKSADNFKIDNYDKMQFRGGYYYEQI